MSRARGGVPVPSESCECPFCADAEADPIHVLDGLVDALAAQPEPADALDAELAGAAFVAMVTAAGAELVPGQIERVIPRLEAMHSPPGLALLLAIAAVAAAPASPVAGPVAAVSGAAGAAADRLLAAGVPAPSWAAELAEPAQVGECHRLHATKRAPSVLAATFRRASDRHACLVTVDDGAARQIFFLDAEELPGALADIRDSAREIGLDFRTEVLTAPEFRWYVEDALDARAGGAMAMPDDEDDAEAPPFPVLATLLRARLAALPAPRRPAATRGRLRMPAPAATAPGPFGPLAADAWIDGPPLGRPPASRKLPARRKKGSGPAPIYQLKVGLSGAKPPIWRRLLVPADVTLASLHRIVQAAFGWHGGHLHVFETPYGSFGDADPELGHRAGRSVTLEQVAPAVKDRIRYTYDFGDNWVHDITVEKALDRDPASTYPRCTGGRRGAPPDDCGGIWGYAELVGILADPDHPEHQERLEWLGLDDADQFDPDAFDPESVDQALPKVR